MPEGPEIRIMSDFINHNTKGKKFINAFHVAKGNKPDYFNEKELPLDNFEIQSDFSGKKLILNLKNEQMSIPIYIFMGMSGSVKFIDTIEWSNVKYTRLRFDSEDGKSLLIYGGYLGPKYSISKNFTTSKNGPDIVKEFDSFVDNVKSSLSKKFFEKPIYEVLLNQEYFAGVGNYLRSTIIYYADVNPFMCARDIINENVNFLSMCKDILEESYRLNGGQLKDWENPFQKDSTEFDNWVYYQKGSKLLDSQDRTFWYNPKWS